MNERIKKEFAECCNTGDISKVILRNIPLFNDSQSLFFIQNHSNQIGVEHEVNSYFGQSPNIVLTIWIGWKDSVVNDPLMTDTGMLHFTPFSLLDVYGFIKWPSVGCFHVYYGRAHKCQFFVDSGVFPVIESEYVLNR